MGNNKKKHRVRYSVQPELRRNHEAETLGPKDEWFLPWWFLRGFWLKRIPNECVFDFYPVISWINIFMGNYSCFHIGICLRFSTSDFLCLNVHLNCLSQENHQCKVVSRDKNTQSREKIICQSFVWMSLSIHTQDSKLVSLICQ